MKKSIFIFGLVGISFCLTAFGYMNWNDLETDPPKGSCEPQLIVEHSLLNPIYAEDIDLVYDVDSRFIHTVTKEQVMQANSVLDLLPQKETKFVEACHSSEVALVDTEEKISETGDSETLNSAQLELLRSLDYSNNFFVRADYKIENTFGEVEHKHVVYYMTITPETEATYTSGQDALIDYLKENTWKETLIITKDQLRPGQVSFIISPAGTVDKVKLTSTCGYSSIDTLLVELIQDMPGKWNPATDSQGKAVEQEFTFFFGMQGC